MRPVSYERLLNLAHQRAIDGKGGLAASIAKTCLDSQADLSPEELQLTFEILRQLIDKVDIEIRRYVSDYLAERSDVPQDLIDFLANDKINVAYPILVHSSMLSDEQLVDIIGTHGQSHHMAITERSGISEKVSAALVNTKDAEVIIQLVKNFTAKISTGSFSTLVDKSKTTNEYCEILARRRDLPIDLAEKMYSWVGETLRQYMAQNFDMKSDIIRDAADFAIDKAAQNGFTARYDPIEQFDITPAQAEKIVREFQVNGLEGFIKEFSFITGLSKKAANSIFDPDAMETMAIACKAIGFKEKQFLYFLKTVSKNNGTTDYSDAGEIQRAKDYFTGVSLKESKTILMHWKKAPDTQWH